MSRHVSMVKLVASAKFLECGAFSIRAAEKVTPTSCRGMGHQQLGLDCWNGRLA